MASSGEKVCAPVPVPAALALTPAIALPFHVGLIVMNGFARWVGLGLGSSDTEMRNDFNNTLGIRQKGLHGEPILCATLQQPDANQAPYLFIDWEEDRLKVSSAWVYLVSLVGR